MFGVLTLTLASWRDALFLGILVANVAIGSFQEVRSKRALDRLAALVAPEAVAVRDGADRRVPVDGVVVGDLVRLAAGDQVIADGTVGVRGWARSRRVQPHRRVGARGAGPGRAGVVWVVRGRRRCAVRGRRGRPGQPRGAARGDRARLPASAFAARAGQRPPAAVAGRARGTARDRSHHVRPRRRRVDEGPRADRHRRGRQSRARGVDPADQPDRGGVGLQDGSARCARAAAQCDRVARVG